MLVGSKKTVARLVALTSLISAALAVSIPALAQENSQDQVDEKIRACGTISDPDERMDCFNSVVEDLDANNSGVADSVPAAAPAAAGAAVATESAVDEFGLEEQKAAEARKKEEELAAQNQLESINATIVTSNKSGLNHFVVALDNGQVWEETDGSRRPGLPKVGASVHIYRGKLGGYRMKVGNDNRISWVRRLR